MCGIAGYLDVKNGVDIPTLINMNNAARHRGPDDEGYALIDSCAQAAAGADTLPTLKAQLPDIRNLCARGAFLGLGHRRLSIIDITQTGHQPMRAESGRVCVAYNGEIYNYIELREELQAKGYTFFTASDTEVLLNAYLAWGESCVARFNGMWAFILWDAKENKLFCSRDRLGKKPLHYYRNQDKLLLSSELKQILADTSVPRVMNEPYLAAMLVYGLQNYDENTLVRDIKSVCAGHNFIVRLNGAHTAIQSVNEYAYWQLAAAHPNAAYAKKDEAAYAAAAGNALSDAVRLRLRGDVPMGALLSGGLDSSSVVTIACDALRRQGKSPATLAAFTTAFLNRPAIDERKYAHMVVENTGCAENWVPADDTLIWKKYEELIYHTETLAPLAILGAFNMLSRVSAHGIKVLLNGQGGDETLLGYERYYACFFHDLIKKGKWLRAFHAFRDASRHAGLTMGGLAKYYVYFNMPLVRDGVRRRRAKALYTPRIRGALPYAKMRALLYPKNIHELQRREITQTQLPRLLYWDDRMAMAHGVESRVPFTDYRFVEIAADMPPAAKIAGGYTKYILRRYMQGRMPDEIVWRIGKLGYPAPTDDWIAAIDPAYCRDLLNEARSAPYFDMRAMRGANDTPDAKRMVESGFMAAELFMRLFDMRPA
ncbi:MAG: asparagine synthase (glutamine-hydrolyzing) [Clostridiales bacterium]|jgi:asparagine synthase (glutamine-hydrolysing)|nr:asparagine synthase (glutamine-hydrolyzing) [Clostridiales bacterium]